MNVMGSSRFVCYDSDFIFNLNYPKISKATGIVINSDNATRKTK